MDADERARHGRYVFARDRDLFLVTRALVRTVLSGYVPEVTPGQWVFTPNPWGRPEVTGPAGVTAPRFNLSNTHGMVVLLVAREREVGVDVERLDRRAPVEVAERYFAPAEVSALRSLPTEAARERRFHDYWTLKESYIKARGMGLALPLDRFAFTVEPGAPVGITMEASLGDNPAAWEFTQVPLGASHLVAAAVQRVRGTRAALVLRPAVHLHRQGP